MHYRRHVYCDTHCPLPSAFPLSFLSPIIIRTGQTRFRNQPPSQSSLLTHCAKILIVILFFFFFFFFFCLLLCCRIHDFLFFVLLATIVTFPVRYKMPQSSFVSNFHRNATVSQIRVFLVTL